LYGALFVTPRRPPTRALNAPIAELADVLEPDAPVQDFAFADTVIAAEELVPPPSARAIVHYPSDPNYQTPLSFPLPAAAPDTSFETQARALWAHVRHGLAAAREELMELWVCTEDLVGTASARGALGKLRFFGRRLVALWSFWHWDRMDVVRAAMIGIAVFLAAATFASSTLAPEDPAAAASTSDDLRSPHTLDQHTAKVQPARVKVRAR